MKNSNEPGTEKETPAKGLKPEIDTDKETQPQGRREVGGPPGPEPTRYGDWEKKGRCIDF